MPTLGTRRTLAVLVLAALGAVGILGCSNLPTAPAAGTDAESRLLRTQPSAGLGGPGGGGLEGVILSGSTSALTRTVQSVTGTTGGIVSAGRFSVEVPPGAFNGTGDITVDVADSTILRVDLHIAQVPNQFEVPVRLVVSWDGFEGSETDPQHFKVFWHDEEAGVWRMLPTTVDLEAKTVSTLLEHFSTYGVLEAKAGW